MSFVFLSFEACASNYNSVHAGAPLHISFFLSWVAGGGLITHLAFPLWNEEEEEEDEEEEENHIEEHKKNGNISDG